MRPWSSAREMTDLSERLGIATAPLGFCFCGNKFDFDINYCMQSNFQDAFLLASSDCCQSSITMWCCALPVSSRLSSSPATTKFKVSQPMNNAMYYWRPICMQLCPEPCKLHVTAVKYATTRIVSAAYRLACATLHQDQEILRPLEEKPYIDGKRTGVH